MRSRAAIAFLTLALAGATAFFFLRWSERASAASTERTSDQWTVIRRPAPSRPEYGPPEAHKGLQNLAPSATVSVSSVAQPQARGEGVADGVVDSSEWVTEGETAGAWIELRWARPVTVVEVELHDRADPDQNVIGGVLTFDDGSYILVPALPPDGSPWNIEFPPKRVQSVTFRVNGAQGLRTGLAEIEVYGPVN